MLYEIVIRGFITEGWFEKMTVIGRTGSETIMRGQLIDQAALQGVLRRISGLGMELISVNCIPEAEGPQAKGHDTQEKESMA